MISTRTTILNQPKITKHHKLEPKQNTLSFSSLNHQQHFLPLKLVLGPSIDQNLGIRSWYTIDVHLPTYMRAHPLLLTGKG